MFSNFIIEILHAEVDKEAINILKRIAAQDFSNSPPSEVPRGHFTHVRDPQHLRKEMATYYDFFSKRNNYDNDIQMTVPYFDAFGLGVVVSICKSVRDSVLKGVTCVDVSLIDLLEGVEFFNAGPTTYAFLVDSTRRVIIHPLFPRPVDALEDPLYVPINQLEPEMTDEEIDKIMK